MEPSDRVWIGCQGKYQNKRSKVMLYLWNHQTDWLSR